MSNFDADEFRMKSHTEQLDLASVMEKEINIRNQRKPASKTSNKKRKKNKAKDEIAQALEDDAKLIHSDMETEAEPQTFKQLIEDTRDAQIQPVIPVNVKANPPAAEPANPTTEAKPIVVYQITDISKFASELEKSAKFSLKSRKDSIRILPDSLEDKVKIIEFLNKTRADYYIVPDIEYPLKAVIRGLPITMDIESIKDHLTSLKFDVTNVIQMTRRISREPMPLFLLHLARNPKSEEIFKLARINHVIVKVEPYRQPRKALQCFLCQSFFHTSLNCHRRIACVRCGLGHELKDCEEHHRKVNAPINLHCINCGGTHPSSYKGCLKFENSTAPKRRPVTYADAAKPRTTQSSNNRTTVTSSNQYSVALKRAFQQQPPAITELNTISRLIHEIKEELNVNSFAEIQTILESALAKVRNAKTPEAKLFAFMDALAPPKEKTTPAESPLDDSRNLTYKPQPSTSSRDNSHTESHQVIIERPFSGTPRNQHQPKIPQATPSTASSNLISLQPPVSPFQITEGTIRNSMLLKTSDKTKLIAAATRNNTAPFDPTLAAQELNRLDPTFPVFPAFGQLQHRTPASNTTQSLPSQSRRTSISSLASQD